MVNSNIITSKTLPFTMDHKYYQKKGDLLAEITSFITKTIDKSTKTIRKYKTKSKPKTKTKTKTKSKSKSSTRSKTSTRTSSRVKTSSRAKTGKKTRTKTVKK